ncbi:MAG TPA: FtsQ-type POTRA domain-containing protein [Terriglobales bacterium]|jgi:cell division protein FtsQ|nr:FtsQ-type POTRA domain-containing protein [Terriglobales bacterium]
MARKNAPTISQEELYPQSDEPTRQDLDDARLFDLDAEQESPFLRGQKRVSVRRSSLPKKTVTRLTWTLIVLVVMFLGSVAVAAVYHYGERSWRFRVDSSDHIEITGLENVTRSQVMEVIGGDIGRNIFFVPMAQRKKQLEQIPWVESASVMRFVPNRLKIEIHERTPVAFARVGSRILLVDDVGTLMELPNKKKYSFPVILGMNSGEPLSTRIPRMRIYDSVLSQLDSSGAHYSQDLSEVDLSDPDDVKVLTNNPEGEVLIHLGSSNYLDRYKVYVGHVREWRQQFDRVESVDLRYDRQIIVNPDLNGAVKQPPLSRTAAKAAMAAGVKPAALTTRLTTSSTALVPRRVATPEKKRTVKAWHRKPSRKKTWVSKTGPSKKYPRTATQAARAARKPSPSIAKEQEHP